MFNNVDSNRITCEILANTIHSVDNQPLFYAPITFGQLQATVQCRE